MFSLASPWLLLLLGAPLLVYWISPAHRERRPALSVPFLDRLVQLTGRDAHSGAVVIRASVVQRLMHGIVWLALVLACARPQYTEAPITRTIASRDLLVAVDLSGSMETEDFTNADGERTDRVTAVREVLDEFLARREGDRVGLIVFGTAPFVQIPFTEDLDTCRALLPEMQARMAGPQTMLGDAIGKAINIFDNSDLEEQVLILLTDGNDTGSLVPPVKAAEIAHDRGIVIHVIGMGNPATVGEEKLDTETLEAIAQATGGSFFLALDREQLEQVYAELDRLSTRELQTQSYRPVRELYFWPLGFGLVLVVLYHSVLALRQVIRLRREVAVA